LDVDVRGVRAEPSPVGGPVLTTPQLRAGAPSPAQSRAHTSEAAAMQPSDDSDVMPSITFRSPDSPQEPSAKRPKRSIKGGCYAVAKVFCSGLERGLMW